MASLEKIFIEQFISCLPAGYLLTAAKLPVAPGAFRKKCEEIQKSLGAREYIYTAGKIA